MKLLERLERSEMPKEQLKIMMTFMKEEEITKMNKALVLGKYTVSVQCSAGHYCNPRTTTDLDKYTHMEMALWLTGTSDWSEPNNFYDFELINELEESFEGTVYGHVSIECLERFLNYLESKEG